MSERTPASLVAHRLVATPHSMHVETGSGVAGPIDAYFEVAAPSGKSMCVSNLRSNSTVVRDGCVNMTDSATRILEVASGQDVVATPVRLVHATISLDESRGEELGQPLVSLSQGCASALGAAIGDRVSLCPRSYSDQAHDVRAIVSRIVEGERCVVGMTASLCLDLEIAPGSEIGVHAPVNHSPSSITLRVSRHPGLCFLSHERLDELGANDGDVIELRALIGKSTYAQARLITDEMRLEHDCVLDWRLADILETDDRPNILAARVDARLCWTVKAELNDWTNRAISFVELAQADIAAGGYTQYETVTVLTPSGRTTAKVIQSRRELPPGTIGLSALMLRSGNASGGSGVFLSTEHEKLVLATVGIFNIEEVGQIVAKGSAQLAEHFALPCWVEALNPDMGTSMDLWLERDRSERPSTLIRMPRAVRTLLLVKPGDVVMVKPAPRLENAGASERGIRSTMGRLANQMLLTVIDRRRMQLSLAPAHIGDDEAHVARVASEKLAILGINEGDFVRISYRGTAISRLTLSRDAASHAAHEHGNEVKVAYADVPLDLQISLDATGRYALSKGRQLEFGTVLIVERDMAFMLRKSLNLTVLPLVGTVVTVIALLGGRSDWVQVAAFLALFSFFFYLSLSVERARVR